MTTSGTRMVALHVDDLGASLGANVAFERTLAMGAVMAGSIIMNGAWVPDLIERCQDADVDLGIHLTLNSESAGFRWRPLSTTSTRSGLIDDDGYMWSDVDSLRRNAEPEAVRDELTAQVEAAHGRGLDVSHIDHHMGAALVPELVEILVDVAIAAGLPTLFPADIAGYVDGVDWADDDLGVLAEQRDRLVDAGLAFADRFVIPLRHLGEPVRPVLEAVATMAEPGYNYVSLHCAAGLDIDAIHPGDAAWRREEYELLIDRRFVAWLSEQNIELVDVRSHV